MSKKITYEYVKNFIEVESNSQCKLLTSKEDYKNTMKKLYIECKCGEIFTVSFHAFNLNQQEFSHPL